MFCLHDIQIFLCLRTERAISLSAQCPATRPSLAKQCNTSLGLSECVGIARWLIRDLELGTWLERLLDAFITDVSLLGVFFLTWPKFLSANYCTYWLKSSSLLMGTWLPSIFSNTYRKNIILKNGKYINKLYICYWNFIMQDFFTSSVQGTEQKGSNREAGKRGNVLEVGKMSVYSWWI